MKVSKGVAMLELKIQGFGSVICYHGGFCNDNVMDQLQSIVAQTKP